MPLDLALSNQDLNYFPPQTIAFMFKGNLDGLNETSRGRIQNTNHLQLNNSWQMQYLSSYFHMGL